MADPFSITGSAVGVVSLGIVVCKELYTLLEDVKTATDKAKDIRAGLDRLEDHLERLETELGKLGSTGSVAGASASVVACANVLNRFRDEIPGIASANESKIRQKFQILRFRLSYPFKKGELQYLRTLVKDIHQNLHTAQLTVLIEQGRLNNESLGDRISLESQLIQRTFTDRHRDLETSFDSQLSLQTRSIQTGFQHLGSETSLIRTDVTQIHSMLQPLAGSLPQLSLLQGSLSRLESKVDDLNPINMALRVSHGDLSGAQSFNHTLRSFQHRNTKLRRKTPLCNCRPTTTKAAFSWWSAIISSSTTNAHAPECSYRMFDDQLTDIDFRISVCSTLLRRKFTLAMGISRSLSKPFASRTELRAVTIVGYYSEAFSLIRRYALLDDDALYKPDSWKETAVELQRLFETRQASPHDRLSDGFTLMHELCEAQVHVYRKEPSLLQTAVDNFRGLAGYLLDHTEGTAQEKDDCGRTCLEECDPDLNWSAFITQLLEHDVSISTRFIRYPGSKAEWMQKNDFTNYEHLLEFSGTYTAIFWKHDLQFSEHVWSGQALLDSQLEDLNMYEMAATMSWTEGCRILIDASSNGVKLHALPHDYFRWVVNCGDVEFLQFWLNIRPDLDEYDLEALGSLEGALYWAIHTHDKDKLDAIIAALVTQRRNLEALAVEYLCEADYSPNHDRLLDAKAWEICDILRKQGVDVSPVLIPSRTCIYHLSFIFIDLQWTTCVLDCLYEAGFKDIGMKDHWDTKGTFVTPLLFYLGYAPCIYKWARNSSPLGWSLAKGSDIDERWPGSPSKGTHLMGSLIGKCIYEEDIVRAYRCRPSPGFYDWISIHTASSQAILGEEETNYPPTQEVLDAKLWQGIREALADKTPDRCNCHCSSSGCVPMSLLCKAVLPNYQVREAWPPYRYGQDYRWDLHLETSKNEAFLNVLPHINDCQSFTIIIRMITFCKLEIRHTCCDLGSFAHAVHGHQNNPSIIKPEPFYSPKDTKRIHKEDRHLIEALEKLVPELDQAYDDLGLPFNVFVDSHMLPRIDEELRKLAEEDHEQFSEGRRALDVVMEPMPGHISDEEVESGSEGGGEGGKGQESSDEYDSD